MSEAFRLKGNLESPQTDLSLLWDLGCEGMWQDGADIVAYFPERLELSLDGTWESVDNEAYLERYYAELTPVYLDKLVVAPTHTEISLRAGQKPIWLDPGMAFGTGHHETTRLALGSLDGLELFGKDVLDVGAGSGILTIAADALGAKTAHGVDIDPETLPVAEANRQRNRSRASFALGTVQDCGDDSADVIVANLFAELHLRLVGEYRRVLRPDGWLLLTGIINEKLADVLGGLKGSFDVTGTPREGAWSLVSATPR